MQFNVADLLKEPVGSTRSYDIDETLPPLEEVHLVWAKGTVKLTRINRSLLIAAKLDSMAECICSRCLAYFSLPIKISLEEEYFPRVDITTGRRLGTPEPFEGDFTVDDHNIIDLTEAVRQYAIVGLPMKPLCLESCQGICSGCGVNLNESQCVCDNAARDPKWGPLLEAFSS